MLLYTVRCEFDCEESIVKEWMCWLEQGHISDVIKGGATQACIVKIDAERPVYEVRYQFPDRQSFEIYERDCAPALREEGLKKFPPETGIRYSRTVGESIFHLP